MRVPESAAYRRLVSATVISQVGDWATRIALAVLIYEQTGDERWVGAMAAAFVLPWLGAGQLLTSWSDRFNRQEVMVCCDLIRAGLFAVIALVDLGHLPLIGIVILAATVDPVFEANASALSYGALPNEDRDAGVKFKQVINQIAQVGAVASAGIAVAWASPQAVVFVNAMSFALSAAIVASTKTSATARGDNEDAGSIREAFKGVMAHPHFRPALLVTMLTIFSAQAVEAQIAVLAGTPQPDWVLPIAAACIPAATAVGVATAPSDGSTRKIIRQSLLVTTGAAVWAIFALELGGAAGAIATAICAGLMLQTTTSGQVVAFRYLPEHGKAATINIAQTLVFVVIGIGAAVSGMAMAALGRERGLQACLLLALTAWLIPTPKDDTTGEAAGNIGESGVDNAGRGPLETASATVG